MRWPKPGKAPAAASVRLRAICAIHPPSAPGVMPAMWTRLVLRSMTKSTRYRASPPKGEHLNAEEVRRGDRAPVGLQECLPWHRLSPQRRGLDAVPLEDVLNGGAPEVEAEVLK